MKWLIVLVINCCLGSLFVGFCFGQMNVIALEVYKAYNIQEAAIQGLTQSLLTVGGAVGAFVSSIFLKLLSRKTCLQATDLLSILSIIVCFIDSKVGTLLISRFLMGVCLGLNGVFVPLYIKEIAPTQQAGFLGTFNQLFITIGTLIAFLMGSFQQVELPLAFYKIMLLLPIIPCAIRALTLETYCNYETPIYCSRNQLNDKLQQLLRMIYEESEFQKLNDELRLQPKQQNSKNSFISLTQEKYKRRFMVGCSLALIQQLGGINGIMFYSSSIFDQITGHDSQLIYQLNIVVGLIGLITAALSTIIIEKYGRREILYKGQLVCFISLQSLTLLMTQDLDDSPIGKFFIILMIFGYLAGFGISMGPLLFIYLTEILPEQGVSFVAFVNWFASGMVAQLFPIIASFGINYCFGIFSMFNLIGFYVIFNYVVETKGLNEQEIDQAFCKNDHLQEAAVKYEKTPQDEIII